jgi:hypothetical protein
MPRPGWRGAVRVGEKRWGENRRDKEERDDGLCSVATFVEIRKRYRGIDMCMC